MRRARLSGGAGSLRLGAALFLLPLLSLAGCAFSLDLLGVQETVVEREHSDPLADDKLDDKHPQSDEARTVREQFDGCWVTLNKSASVTRLSISQLAGTDADLDGRLFPTRAAALAGLGDRRVLASMEVVNGALKPFNDGLYAAVELGAEDGSSGALVNKRQLWRDLLANLVMRAQTGTAAEATPADAAATRFAAGLLLAGDAPTAPAATVAAAQTAIAAFDADPLSSRPIGFYTWTPELGAIFRRDRLLQQHHLFSSGPSDPLFSVLAETALVLNQDVDLKARYRGVLGLYAGLTDPFYDVSPIDLGPSVPDAAALANLGAVETAFIAAHPANAGLTPQCQAGIALLPASDSADNRLLRKLVCSGMQPPGETLLDLLIAEIQSGKVDLTPGPGAGWYDQEIYALETLLVPDRAPESDHLLLTREYKEKLVETFKSMLIQTRETHVKQVGIIGSSEDTSAAYAPRPFKIYPALQVEPFPSFYVRTARAYRFVEGVLRASLGNAFVDATARLLEDGTRPTTTLGAELHDKELVLYGLHVVATDSIGSAYDLSAEEMAGFSVDAARTRALDWLTTLTADKDVNRDPRVSLPVATETDPATNAPYAVYWAVVGEKVVRMHASFPEARRPEIVSVDPGCVLDGWVPYEPYMLVEQTLQLRRPVSAAPLTRDQFRALCDQHKTVDAITAAFESAP